MKLVDHEKIVLSLVKSTAIIVTTFNPNIKDFKTTLESYINQVILVVVCDNSDRWESQSEIKELLRGYGSTKLLSMGGNKGIAEAQNFGINYSIVHGFKYFIEIDQDSTLPHDYVVNIAASYIKLLCENEKVAGVGPLATRPSDDAVYGKGKYGKGLIRVDKTLSSGFFFSQTAFEIVGLKNELLFIDYVDWDWCWRAKRLGLNTFIDSNLKIKHIQGSGYKRFIFFNVNLSAPIRNYYQFRNSFYMMGKNYVPLSWKVKRLLINIIKLPVCSFFIGEGVLRRKYIFKALKDVVAGKRGIIRD